MADKKKQISNDDIFSLNLLGIQKAAVQLVLYADLLSYKAALEGEEVIFNKYSDIDNGITSVIPDITVIQALLISSIARVMFYYTGISRYEFLYNKSLQGEWDYSLDPNIFVNISNTVGFVGLDYAFAAAIEFYNRDIVTPIFGIR